MLINLFCFGIDGLQTKRHSFWDLALHPNIQCLSDFMPPSFWFYADSHFPVPRGSKSHRAIWQPEMEEALGVAFISSLPTAEWVFLKFHYPISSVIALALPLKTPLYRTSWKTTLSWFCQLLWLKPDNSTTSLWGPGSGFAFPSLPLSLPRSQC